MRTFVFVITVLIATLQWSTSFAAASGAGSGEAIGTQGEPISLEALPGNSDLEDPPLPMPMEKTLANGKYMSGLFTYGFSGSTVSVTLQSIRNDSSLTTGPLRLELWATTANPARGDTNWTGYRLATFPTMSPLAPGGSYSNIAQSAALATPASGTYWIVLVLEEFNTSLCAVADGYWCSQDTFKSFSQVIWGVTTASSVAQAINISTRGLVLNGENVLIGGFVVSGGPRTVVVRGFGPSLGAFGVGNPLSDTTLQVVRSSDGATIATNDDWQASPSAQTISALGFAPSHGLESAVLLTLNPGAYTAILSGYNGATGVGIVAVFMVQ